MVGDARSQRGESFGDSSSSILAGERLMGCKHAQRLETACPVSVSSLCFLRLLMEQLQKHFLASLALQSGRIGLVAMGSVLPSLPTPRPLLQHERGTT